MKIKKINANVDEKEEVAVQEQIPDMQDDLYADSAIADTPSLDDVKKHLREVIDELTLIPPTDKTKEAIADLGVIYFSL